ncbi:hypothetical protein RAZWK3B_06402 [Roseobacter sp. AzwK-3b]|uniref:LPS export ABC transporter permease LptF n=1 Tax=Roseobacter sp. AzwK-3b TaxID=351016 RepID=UPI000156A3C8|nr:LPS export ABC transporter permease LptF [Roseobacter sp. AzwK-3b]EDM70299.1 hypothetical protein RAZWK3B_06402 [Roseobacter sp. AzwK-3b]
MTKFDQYVIRKLITLFAFFALILIAIFWLDKALRMFERLLGKGQSNWLLLELILLTLPPVVASILPIASFASAVSVTNRLSSEAEITIMKASGCSTYRIIRPIFIFGILTTSLMAWLTNSILPESGKRLSSLRSQVDQNITSSFLTEGEFLHPTPGVTLFIGKVTQDAELRRIFLSDRRDLRETIIITAEKAYTEHSPTTVQLLMVDGTTQILRENDNKLFVGRFEEYALDISELVETTYSTQKTVTQAKTVELIKQPSEVIASTKATLGEVAFELHNRFAQPILCAIAAVLGATTLLTGSYSRFGVWRQIGIAFFLLVGLKLVESAVSAHVLNDSGLWFLMYVPSISGAVLICTIIYFIDNPLLILYLKKRLIKS